MLAKQIVFTFCMPCENPVPLLAGVIYDHEVFMTWGCTWDYHHNSLAFSCQQLYEKRGKYVRETERRYWSVLSSSFMSEESAVEDENGEKIIKRHPPQWRSAVSPQVILVSTQ